MELGKLFQGPEGEEHCGCLLLMEFVCVLSSWELGGGKHLSDLGTKQNVCALEILQFIS